MTTDDPLTELRDALTTGTRAIGDVLIALDAVPAAVAAALNRVGRPTDTAQAMRRHTARYAAELRELLTVWTMALAALPDRETAADRIADWFRRQFGDEAAPGPPSSR